MNSRDELLDLKNEIENLRSKYDLCCIQVDELLSELSCIKEQKLKSSNALYVAENELGKTEMELVKVKRELSDLKVSFPYRSGRLIETAFSKFGLATILLIPRLIKLAIEIRRNKNG